MALVYTPQVLKEAESSSVPSSIAPPQCDDFINDLVGIVRTWKFRKSGKKSTVTAANCVRDLWKRFQEKGIIGVSDSEMMGEWIDALTECGYQFPVVPAADMLYRVHLQPTSHSQMIETLLRYKLTGDLFRFRSYNQYMAAACSPEAKLNGIIGYSCRPKQAFPGPLQQC
jgi:hypothetical protein